jgi:hypothetical protein
MVGVVYYGGVWRGLLTWKEETESRIRGKEKQKSIYSMPREVVSLYFGDGGA